MYTEVYADVLFLVNFSMDVISLYVTARLCASKISAKRLALGGIIGGIYSVLSLVLGLNFYLEIFIFLLVCVLMCAVSLYPDGFLSALKYSAVMFVASSLLGGVMTVSYGFLDSFFSEVSGEAIPKNFSPLVFVILALLSMAAALFMCSLHGSGNMPDKCEVKIKIFGKEIAVSGIFDSGNMLRDSLSGRAVIVVDARALSGVFSKKFLDGAACGDTAALYTLSNKEKSRFRLIPAQSVGGSSYLWGITPDLVSIEYIKKGKSRVAVREAVIGVAAKKELCGDVKCIVPLSII